jgi:glutamyl-tRNA synthetase
MVRVRFAPSPTGYLHVGNARTALFNYLFAKKQKGAFVLRIEDTDIERSNVEYEAGIIEDLKWIGLEWNEGPDIGGPYAPYRQSERLEVYREYARRLLDNGLAYRCWCTKEELEARRQKAKTDGKSQGYDNRCRNLSKSEIDDYISSGRKPAIRFRVPEKKIFVNDLIRGTVAFDTSLQPDFVIMKSDGIPTFHFAVVIDDLLMHITHVIRGEDHLSNTPKHLLIYEALDERPPEFAHMSMTLGPDRSRLSKRHGATSVRQYREEGYLPEAFFNYIALLGWGSTSNQEIFTKEQLIDEFSLERCNKSSAIFDPKKLLWLNGLYLRKADPRRLAELALPFLRQSGLIGENPDMGFIAKLVALEQEKLQTLRDTPERIGFFLKEKICYEGPQLEKFRKPEVLKHLAKIAQEFRNTDPFSSERLESVVRSFCEQNNLKTADVFHPLRFATTGVTKGPGLFILLEILGKKVVLERIGAFLEAAGGEF